MSKYYLSNKRTSFKKYLFNKINIKNFLFFSIILIFITALIISPEKYIKVAFNGTLIWATAILPALFPFMIFTKLLTSTGYIEKFSKILSPLTRSLYKTSGISSYIFLMSIISGYPLGAKITSDLYEEGIIERDEAHRICAFTSNSGPMFIIGTVGVGMLLSSTSGYIILISHILSALLNGFIYRNYKPKAIQTNLERGIKTYKSENDIITKSMENSVVSILLIGGYITIFFVITEILFSLGIFSPLIYLLNMIGIESSVSGGIIFGAFEITKGCLQIASSTISLSLKTIICSLIISFGGLSAAFQAFSFLNKFNISKKFFFLQKTTHSIITTIITILILLIFPLT